jgi:hypothetical protein
MAIRPEDFFPPSRVNAADANYPDGSAKDESAPAANDGTPAMQAAVFNDPWGFFQKLLAEASITASGNPDTVVASDYYDALLASGIITDAAIGDVSLSKVTSDNGRDHMDVSRLANAHVSNCSQIHGHGRWYIFNAWSRKRAIWRIGCVPAWHK